MTNGFRLAFQIGQIARRVGGLNSYPPKWTVSGLGRTTMSSPSFLADTAAITIPKIDVDSSAVKALLKTGMSESEEVLEYLGGNIASDLKAAAAKAATRRDLALGPKSKLDETAVNASMDELASRAKAVAPFWVGPGVDDTASPGSERATHARKKAGETTTVKKEPAPPARAPLAPPAPKPPATAQAKPKPVSTKTDAPVKPKPTPPAREANSNHKMIPKMPTLPKPFVRHSTLSKKLSSHSETSGKQKKTLPNNQIIQMPKRPLMMQKTKQKKLNNLPKIKERKQGNPRLMLKN
mgnify:CR=1 FL=1